jgi:murein DD-endopeptidase MepM/ murein hydrolase activator NlpD
MRGSLTGAALVFLLSACGTYLGLGLLSAPADGTPAPAIARNGGPEPVPGPILEVANGHPASDAATDLGEPRWQGPILPPGEAPVLGPASTLRIASGRISAGSTLDESLRAQDVSPRVVFELTHAIKPVFDFRYARPGDFFRLVQDHRDEILSFEFQRGRRTVYRLERDASSALVAEASEVPLELRTVVLSGAIDHSLFESVLELGEAPDLVNEFADIFSWDFDFSTRTRPGDEFRMIFEKYYDREGFVRYGKILAARYQTADADFSSIYFEDESGYGDYYTPEGRSVRRAFLRAPVKYSRISSRYSRSRLHPILKVRRSHLGVDYVAPPGTPVWAVADGAVIYKGWNGGMGRLVRVRHNNGYVSSYGHLQRYGNLRVGSRVRQKQVIGYVGSSGLATGPHVHFELRSNGRYVNPLRVDFPKGEPVSLQDMDAFGVVRDALMRQLEASAPALILEARQETLAE